MPGFTHREIRITILIGIVAFFLGSLIALTGFFCLDKEIGTPEYIVSLRNTGLTIIVLSVLWIVLALFRKLTLH